MLGRTAYLVDYEGDITKKYALEEQSNNTFRLEPAGVMTFEVHAAFVDGRDVSSTGLADALKSK